MSHSFRETFDHHLEEILDVYDCTLRTWYYKAGYFISNYNMWEEASQFGDQVIWYIYVLTTFIQRRVNWNLVRFNFLIVPITKCLIQTKTLYKVM